MGDSGDVELELACRHPPSIGAALSESAEKPPPHRLYLASTSPARLATLRAAGIEPVVIPSELDEEAAVAAAEREAGAPLAPAEHVLLLARLKAEAVAAGTTDPDGTAPGGAELDGAALAGAPLDGLVLGGDSAFELDGVLYGKPHLPEVALERWRRQRGRSGVLHSGHWLVAVEDGRVVAATGAASQATVHFAADLDDAELEAYVASGEPLEVAGAFTIDAKGGPYIDRIEGDPHTVVGLSLPVLRRLVRALGYDWHGLWNHG